MPQNGQAETPQIGQADAPKRSKMPKTAEQRKPKTSQVEILQKREKCPQKGTLKQPDGDTTKQGCCHPIPVSCHAKKHPKTPPQNAVGKSSYKTLQKAGKCTKMDLNRLGTLKSLKIA